MQAIKIVRSKPKLYEYLIWDAYNTALNGFKY